MPKKSQKAKLILTPENKEQLQRIASTKGPTQRGATGQHFIAIFRKHPDHRYRENGPRQQTDDL